MIHGRKQAMVAADFIREKCRLAPYVGILTGTGLGDGTEGLEMDAIMDYSKIPHMPASTVQGHAGKLILGRMAGVPMIRFQGRFHLYEGYDPAAVTFPIRVMQEMGVCLLILTNAAGGVCPDFEPGDIMIIRDHLNLTGENPLIGPNEDNWGIRFPDMSFAYDAILSKTALEMGEAENISVKKGIYAGLKGPSLETPAEIRYLKTMGADAVGFSTVQESIAAVHARMRVLGLSVITNVHDPDNPEPTTVESVIAVAGTAAQRLQRLLHRIMATSP